MGRRHLRAILFLSLVSAAGALLAQNAPSGNSDQTEQSEQGAGQGANQGTNAGAAAGLTSETTPTQGPAQRTGRTFVVNGQTVNAEVVSIGGRSYVDVDSLAQIATITNGSMTVEPNRIVLTIPVQGANPPAPGAPGAPAAPAVAQNPPALPGFSKGFVSVAINALADMREWRGATETLVTYGMAVSDAWAQGYRNRAQQDLMQTAVSAATDDDRNALALLRNEDDALANWSSTVLSNRQALNGAPTIDPNTLANDTALAKINTCSEFLSGMLLSGTFSDNASCH